MGVYKSLTAAGQATDWVQGQSINTRSNNMGANYLTVLVDDTSSYTGTISFQQKSTVGSDTVTATNYTFSTGYTGVKLFYVNPHSEYRVLADAGFGGTSAKVILE